ncbi:hypothetical protein AOLI_G00147390 [Acnodon oligacanthus]
MSAENQNLWQYQKAEMRSMGSQAGVPGVASGETRFQPQGKGPAIGLSQKNGSSVQRESRKAEGQRNFRGTENDGGSSPKIWMEKVRKAAGLLDKEHLEAQMRKHIQQLLEANEQLQDELLMKNEKIKEMRQKGEEEKRVEKIWEMLVELSSENLEVNIQYEDMMKQKMKELELERELIRDLVTVTKESDRMLLLVLLVVIQKQADAGAAEACELDPK